MNLTKLLPLLAILLISACSKKEKEPVNEPAAEDEVILIENFASDYVDARNVEIWLPTGYDPDQQYNLLVMHDGQNVFNAQSAYGGVEWRVDEVLDSLINAGAVAPTIVVAPWNNGVMRMWEYAPDILDEVEMPWFQDSLKVALERMNLPIPEPFPEDPFYSKQYLSFLVRELIPYMEEHYPIRKGPEHTAVMGSSMGGLISLFAITKYPDVFGSAGCVSTHWPLAGGYGNALIDHLSNVLPDPATHKIYFDHGTTTLDALYPPYQQRADSVMVASGWTKGQNFESLVFEGARHNEADWTKRVHIPLMFVLD